MPNIPIDPCNYPRNPNYAVIPDVDSLPSQAGRGNAAPRAFVIQDGRNVGRLPDVFCQPESGTLLQLPINKANCQTQFINAPTGQPTVFISHKVPNNRKLIIEAVDIRFSNPYAGQYVTAFMMIDNIYVSVKAAVNRPAAQPFVYRIVVNGGRQIRVLVTTNVTGYNLGTFSAQLTGWEVDDSYPLDKREDK